MRADLIEKLAVHNTLDETLGRYIDLAYRHYSTTYHTPLHIAEEIVPEEKVLLIFFEDRLESLDAMHLKDTISKIYEKIEPEVLNSGVDVSEQISIGDEEWIARMNLKLKKQMEEKTKIEAEKKAKEVTKAVDDVINKFNKSISEIKAQSQPAQKLPPQPQVK